MNEFTSFDEVLSRNTCNTCKPLKTPNYKVGDVFIDRDRRGKDRGWSLRKQKNQDYAEKLAKVADLLAQEDSLKISQAKLNRVMDCAEVMLFRDTTERVRLEHAFLCKDKMCPICSWRRSRKNGQSMRLILERFVNEQPKARYLHLTLTVKNCYGSDLSQNLLALTQAFNRLKKYKRVERDLIGFIRGTEVTYNLENDNYHPHIHVLLAVKSSYFKKGHYINQREWSDLWQKALKVDYSPMVHISKVKESEMTVDDDFSDLNFQIPQGLFKALLEVCKYPLKPLNLPDDFEEEKEIEVLKNLFVGLFQKRQMGLGGRLKEIKAELEEEGKNLDEDELIESAKNEDAELKDSTRIYTRFYNDFYKIMNVKKVTKEELESECLMNPHERFKHLSWDLYTNTRNKDGT